MALPRLNPGVLAEISPQAIAELPQGYSAAQFENKVRELLFPHRHIVTIEVVGKLGPDKILNWLNTNLPPAAKVLSIERVGEDE